MKLKGAPHEPESLIKLTIELDKIMSRMGDNIERAEKPADRLDKVVFITRQLDEWAERIQEYIPEPKDLVKDQTDMWPGFKKKGPSWSD